MSGLASISKGVFGTEFVSANQVITLGGALTVAHGLGAIPKMVEVLYVCNTASEGYAVNDELKIGTFDFAEQSNSIGGFALVADATNLNVRIATRQAGIPNKASGALNNMTVANWRIKLKAWL